MEHRWKFLVMAIAVLLTARADASARLSPASCKTIARRNAFALVAPEPKHPAEILPRISYTGFTTILGDKRIVLKVRALVSGQSAGERSLVLCEGESRHGIKVLRVDRQGEWAVISCSGREMRLSLER